MGPQYTSDQTYDGVTWFAIYDYGHRQEGLCDGTGCFYVFRSFNDIGRMGDWVLLNGGLISREAGNEQGDLDMIVYVDGKPKGLALTGNMTKFGGPPPGLIPTEDGVFNIGSPGSRYNALYGKKLAIETVGKQVQINGIWQWIDCVEVETQQGTMWIPAFKSFDSGVQA